MEHLKLTNTWRRDDKLLLVFPPVLDFPFLNVVCQNKERHPRRNFQLIPKHGA